jgi:hypothetical protein
LYHQLIRNVIALISKDVRVSLGLDDRSEALKYYTSNDLEWSIPRATKFSLPIFAAAESLEQTFEKFKGLRGVDFELYQR